MRLSPIIIAMTEKTRTVRLRSIEGLPGFVVHWLLCGPFNQDGRLSSCRALKKAYLSSQSGESRTRPRGGNRVVADGPVWVPHAERHGFIVNLARHYSTRGIVCYAAAYLGCPRAGAAQILLGSDDGFMLYLNGTHIAARDVRRGLGIDNDRFDVKLKQRCQRHSIEDRAVLRRLRVLPAGDGSRRQEHPGPPRVLGPSPRGPSPRT
jgi:hypothetical protein